MSAQFGRWNFDKEPADLDYLKKVKSLLTSYGPDDSGSYTTGGTSILYHAFNTTSESRRETQPLVAPSGAVITWDGLLDDRAELIRRLPGVVDNCSTDVEIVAGAYELWGTNCFSRLIGDWALSIWNPHDRSLLLAKDIVGTRHLYYATDQGHVTWSTILDPLVLLADKSFALCEEYIAGWFSFFPAVHLTPYTGIHSVPPATFVRLRDGNCTIQQYWDLDPHKRVRYRTDGEYEEHFRTVLAESIQRRLRTDRPILAELSGGMDSSSIVCVADTILALKGAETPRLDTLSYHDDSEPNWNERPYFTKVEEKRGRVGCHIDVGLKDGIESEPVPGRFAATPNSGSHSSHTKRKLGEWMISHGNRVMLSGIGGDELTGGLPTPTPELADLFTRGRFKTLAHQLQHWALSKRQPWFLLLLDVAKSFLPAALGPTRAGVRSFPWLAPDFLNRNHMALRGYERRLRIFGPLPTFQENVRALNMLRRQLGCSSLCAEPLYEKRYPYLDRGLLEFVSAIPREQLVRPGQRRSLMRRALVGIVPDELLNRRRKAFLARAPLVAVSTAWDRHVQKDSRMACSALGIVDASLFSDALQLARRGQQIPLVPLMRTLGIEFWLQHLLAGNGKDCVAVVR